MELTIVAQSIIAELVADYNATADYWHTLRHSQGYAIRNITIDRDMLILETRAAALRHAMDIIARQAHIEFNPQVVAQDSPRWRLGLPQQPPTVHETESLYDKPAPPARQRYT